MDVVEENIIIAKNRFLLYLRCGVCGTKFRRPIGMARHLKLMHQIHLPRCREINWMCGCQDFIINDSEAENHFWIHAFE